MSLSPPQSRIFGCLLAITSAIFFPLVGMFFKMIEEMFFAQTLLYRFASTAIITTAVHVLCSEESLIGDFEQNKWVTAVAVCTSTCMGLQFLGLTLMPFADFYALIYGGVLPLTLIAGRCWLKETCGVFDTVIASVILVGIALISNPAKLFHFFTDDREVAFQQNLTQLDGVCYQNFTSDIEDDTDHETTMRIIGVGIAMLECVLTTIANSSVRRVKVHFSVTTIHIGVWCICLCAVLCAIFGKFSLPSKDEIIPLIAFIICGIIYQFCFFQALVFQPVGVVAVISTSEIPIAYGLQMAFLHTFPGLMVSLGSGMITLATLVFGIVTLARRQKHEEYRGFPEAE